MLRRGTFPSNPSFVQPWWAKDALGARSRTGLRDRRTRAGSGLKWIEYKDFSEAEERQHMEEAIRLHAEVVGERPRGWYTGRTSMQTVRLAAEEGGFD